MGGADRMSLWSSVRGSRIWEIDVGNGNGVCQAVAIAWSPDGQSIAVVREPLAISIHSLQDGRVAYNLPINTVSEPGNPAGHVTGVWWFRDDKTGPSNSSIPDIFKRNNLITGSAHSILKILPLLDSMQEETDKSTATDLFAFQGSHTHSTQKSHLPKIIEVWPSLLADPAAASIGRTSHGKIAMDEANLDEADTSNLDSVLMVVDNLGRIYSYLDGHFPLGIVAIGKEVDFVSAVKHPSRPLFIGQPRIMTEGSYSINLTPAIIRMPLLSQRKSRDLAKLSTTAREIVWYAMRSVKEMREAWYGSETNTGAREWGPRWIKSLETKQKEQFGQLYSDPILDLTYLLGTGRSSEALQDFLGSGEQMSERGLLKWETTVSEAFIKLRDYSEKRIAPALQRLHIVLEEVQGWSNLQQFSSFELSAHDITYCLDMASRGIIIASWLAAVSRRELLRFREFISWLRYEVTNLNNTSNEVNVIQHDILEVNNYFIAGLEESPVDQWFTGPLPQFRLVDLGFAEFQNGPLGQALEHAHSVAANASQMAWQKTFPQRDLSGVDRNLEALIQELGNCCERVFHHASAAASRSAVVSFDPLSKPKREPETMPVPEQPLGFPFRERSVLSENSELIQHLISHFPYPDSNALLLVELRFEVEAPELPSEIGVALLECYLTEEGEEQSNFDLLDADFFDDECVVIIYRLREGETTLSYDNIGYQNLLHDAYVKRSTREDLMQDTLQLWKDGQLPLQRVSVDRRRALSGCKTGAVSMALNGRVNRRVACVLDSTGTWLESFDMEGDAEDMEVADDAGAG
ncbi:hypothetical protein JR316_0000979 [Psilocybe cubensis]|nr:hypothetical protein JR316_0000979 [Psilocybe cubensis]KAH9486913.1 hypothetical protein JR316_0000979 [Psilocybe cubensis]